MIQFPSDRSDAGQYHVGGSQRKADELIARNMKRAARAQSSPSQRHIAPALILISVAIVAVLVIAITS